MKDCKIGLIGRGQMGSAIAKALPICENVDQADVLILAVPISAILEIGKTFKDAGRPLIVLDIGSVKGQIADKFEEWTNGSVEFVATHPMSAGVFEGAAWVITPHRKNSETALQKVEQLIRELGAHPIRMDAETHDRRACLVSHLPYLISKSLFDFAQAQDPESLLMAGPGFQSTTRLGNDNPALHAEIAEFNRKHIRKILKEYLKYLETL